MSESGKRSSKRVNKPKKQKQQNALAEEIVISGPLDVHSLEALKLEVMRLASSCGLEIRAIDVVTVARQLGRKR